MSDESKAQSWLDELVQHERTATGPPEVARERMWSTIEQRIAHGPPPPELGPEPASAVVGGTSSVALKIVGGVALTGLLAGALAWALVDDRDDEPRVDEVALADDVQAREAPPVESPPVEPPLHEPSSESGVPESPIPEPPVESPEAESLESPDSSPEATLDSPKKGSSKAKAKVVDTVEPASSKGLGEELALMQRLSTALKAGDSAKVLELVAEHKRDFPHGQFVEERSAAEARALCKSGGSKGTSKAEQFAARWPDSIHLKAIRSDCGLDP